ncbi:MAG: S8 family serine peptidase, partial [Acidobacteriota bacterium]|nr:S8 family serine peptidase [Acidobacteriota bacterium]
MKKSKLNKFVSWLVCLAILLSLNMGIIVSGAPAPQNNKGKVVTPAKISADLHKAVKGPNADAKSVNVIIQLSAPASGPLKALLNSSGVHVKGSYKNLRMLAVEMPANVVEQLAVFSEVDYVSPDRAVHSLGLLSATTGADAVRQPASGSSYDGKDIGIAVLDSGIYANHVSFLNKDYKSRITYSADFTGERRTDDPYGHGTHVASIAAGNGMVSYGSYLGIAPNANLINLRVLNSQGHGTTSAVLNALDFVLTNGKYWNIRVVNMSLGMPAVDSYKFDPLDRAVRKLVDNGVVVVAAAGNNGKDANGNKVYGKIHSPGNEPSAITVGASNSVGTTARNDDTMASYSSRGPTRSYWTDTDGVKHYDNLVKPDLVAPGNKIIAAESYGNLLVAQNPILDVTPFSLPTYK